MQKLARIVWLAIIALFTSVALAQAPADRRGFSQAELDQTLAPIALYPDSLLSQILMAATYPQDVFEAAAAVRATGLRGEEAVRAVDNAPWDPSVVSLAAFPEVLAMLDERRDWTERLGDAYIAQPEQVMDTIQELRRRADTAGNLRSSDQLAVQRHEDRYVIESPSPEMVYVPYYDSRVVYGPWWWADYQPVWWPAWAGYSYRVGYGGFGWGYPVRVSRGYFFGSIDWRNRYVRYSSHRPWYYRGGDYRHGNRWTHDRDHRNVVRDSRWRGNDRDGNRGERRQDWQNNERRDAWQGGDRRDGRDRGDRGDYRGRGDRDRNDRNDRDGRDRRSQSVPAPQFAGAAPAAPRFRRAPEGERQAAAMPAPAPSVQGERVQREARSFNAPRTAAVPQQGPAAHRAVAPQRAEARAERRAERAERAERGHNDGERRGRGN